MKPRHLHIHIHSYIHIYIYICVSLSTHNTAYRTSISSSSSSSAMAKLQFSLAFLSLYIMLSGSGVYSATFTVVNQCSYTVWPGILSNAGTPQLSTTGFSLQPRESNNISVPASWSGRLWGRTFCNDDSTGKFTCVTGDCGSGTPECAGGGATPPATLAEFTLNGAGGLDFYDVSLVDGYNLPMLVAPVGGSGGNCTTTGCAADLNGGCPSELRVSRADGGESVACKSACFALGNPEYCCSGAYATPDTCKPTSYSEYFKSACPRAYSYAYDDGTSTFTCASADYVITFCPSPSTSQKSSGAQIAGATDVSLVSSSATKLSFIFVPIILIINLAASYSCINLPGGPLQWNGPL